jgi:hypothetical protein
MSSAFQKELDTNMATYGTTPNIEINAKPDEDIFGLDQNLPDV